MEFDEVLGVASEDLDRIYIMLGNSISFQIGFLDLSFDDWIKRIHHLFTSCQRGIEGIGTEINPP